MLALAEAHDSRIKVDVIRAYHFGRAFNCEMEIVLPALMTVQESHDIALSLQHKIELSPDIERAFVHVSETFFLDIFVYFIQVHRSTTRSEMAWSIRLREIYIIHLVIDTNSVNSKTQSFIPSFVSSRHQICFDLQESQ